MRTSSAATGLFISLVCLTVVHGQDDTRVALESQVEQLQADVDVLRLRFDDLQRLPAPDHTNVAFTQTSCRQGGLADTMSMCAEGGDTGHWTGFTFGFDFVFVQPRFIESFDVQQTNPVTGAATLLPLDFDYSLAPRFSVLYKASSGFGLRAQYWKYDDQTSRFLASGPTVLAVQQLTSVFPATVAAVGGDTLSVANSFQTETLDFEATYDVRLRYFEIVGSLGVRYAVLEQLRQAAVAGAFPQTLDFRRDYRGFGVSTGLNVKRPLGVCGLAAITRARGSVVHGNKTLRRTVTGPFPSPPLPAPPPTPPVVSLADVNESSLIGEIAVGLELHRVVASFDVSARLVYENRFWTGVSTPALGFAGFEGFSAGLTLSR